jgi:Tfp pilus assembly protein PilZ
MRVTRFILPLFALVLSVAPAGVKAQEVPGPDENIPFLITFGKDGGITSWGDDDFSQTFFFAIPKDYKDPFYIRVYDPDIGGKTDELNNFWNTRMVYSIYGGKGCYTNPDANGISPKGNYKSGTLLATRTFGMDNKLDERWFTFGPFNPADGEYYPKFLSNIFKIVCDGVSGDDGNLYRYAISRRPDTNVPIDGANAFTYEYTFRMWNNNDTSFVSHIYPFIDSGCVFVQTRNFDWDNDGDFMVVSVVKKGMDLPISGEDEWITSKIPVEEAEIGKSFDFRFYKRRGDLVKNNNVVVSVQNQYGENLPFFSAPIGGVPVYKPRIKVVPKK